MRATTRCRPWWPGELARAPPRRRRCPHRRGVGGAAGRLPGVSTGRTAGVGLLPRGAPPRDHVGRRASVGTAGRLVDRAAARAALRRPARCRRARRSRARHGRRDVRGGRAGTQPAERPADARDLAALLRANSSGRWRGPGRRHWRPRCCWREARRSALARRAQHRLEIQDRRAVDGLEVLDQDLRVVEREDPGAVQPDRVGAMG